jgi:hypothetical protein
MTRGTRLLAVWLLLPWPVPAAFALDPEERIEHELQRSIGWRKGAYQLVEVEAGDLAPCRFYFASGGEPALPMGIHYALLPDGRLSGSRPGAAADILTSCGQNAAAVSWARVLQQFHVHWPAGEVLEQIDPAGEALLRGHGRSFAPPSFVSRTTDKDTVLHYYIDPVEEVGVLYFVQATIPLSGEIRIEERRLGSLRQPQSPG